MSETKVYTSVEELSELPYKIEVGAPLINFPDGHYAIHGNSRVIAYQPVANNLLKGAAAVNTTPSPSAAAAAPSTSDTKSSLYGVVIAECVVGVLILAVAGYVYSRYRRTKSFGRGSGKPTGFTPNGLPVWEMGQWRVIRAEDWAAMNDEKEDDDEDEKKMDAAYEKHMDSKITIEDSKRSSIACSIENMHSFLPTSRIRNDAMRIPESEEDIESGATMVFEAPTAGSSIHGEDDDDEPIATTIPFNYSLLSQLANEDQEADSSIHMSNSNQK